MFKLPLFPLNTVLFPELPLRLHVFEPRYLHMIGECIDGQQPFGIALIRRGREAMGPLAEPFEVGCLAEIVRHEALPQNRLHITAVGRQRFRTLRVDRLSKPYLVGQVEILSLQAPEMLDAAWVRRLRPWAVQYLALLAKATKTRLESRFLPTEPLRLTYLAASLLQIPNTQKQELLEIDDAGRLAEHIERHYRRETTILETLLHRENRQTGSMGLN